MLLSRILLDQDIVPCIDPSGQIALQSPAGRGMARDFERQLEEIQIRIAALDRYTALRMPFTELMG